MAIKLFESFQNWGPWWHFISKGVASSCFRTFDAQTVFLSCTINELVLNIFPYYFVRVSRWPRFRLCKNLIWCTGVSMTPFNSLYKLNSCSDLGTVFVRNFFLWQLSWYLSVYKPTSFSLNVEKYWLQYSSPISPWVTLL